jgi:hypothetical protein
LSARNRIERALNLEKVSGNVVTLEWWGMYKYEFSGLDYRRAMFNDGKSLASVYENFYEYFKPDWLHLHIGTPKYFEDAELMEEGDERFIIFSDKYLDLKGQDKYFSVESNARKEKIIDIPDYIFKSKKNRPRVDLSNKNKIDEYIKRFVWMDHELIIKLGYTDHVKEIAGRFNDEVFINVHIPSQLCEIIDPFTGYVGFEEGLIAFYDYPEGIKYLIEKCYEAHLEWVKAYKLAGAHGFTISEDNMAADSISPDIYRKFLKPIHFDFFNEVKKIGLFPLLCFWGDINPLLEDLKEVGIKGLLIDESRKNFSLDVVEMIKILGENVCLFGNLDSVNILLLGKIEDIRRELDRQCLARNYGNFIFQNGSPLTPGTSKENIMEFVNYSRRVGDF